MLAAPGGDLLAWLCSPVNPPLTVLGGVSPTEALCPLLGQETVVDLLAQELVLSPVVTQVQTHKILYFTESVPTCTYTLRNRYLLVPTL